MARNAANSTSAVRQRTTTVRDAVALCDEGRYGEALEAVEGWPDGPEKRLIRGACLMPGHPEEAKDLLSYSARLLSGEHAERAWIWLGISYWSIGEKDEARAALHSVTPSTNTTRLLHGLNRSIVESQTPELALSLLREVEHLAEIVGPLLHGKFFYQRGFLLRRMQRRDEAIIAYEEARYWFEKCGDPVFIGSVANNLASLYCDLNDFEQAHRSVNLAIETFENSEDAKFLSDAYDQKAQIYLKQKNYMEANRLTDQVIEILADRDHKESYARALITHARALSGVDRNADAMCRLDQAQALAEFLANEDLLFDVAQSKVLVARQLLQVCDIHRINLTLSMVGGSFRQAALKLGIPHQRLSRWIKKYKLRWNGNKPRRSIVKRS